MTKTRNILAMGLLLAGSVASAQGVKVGGFVAPAFMWTKNSKNTFGVPDGAVYLSHSMDMAEVMIDIPFSMTDSTSNTMSLGMGKAQAYVHHKWENGLFWKLGQFDGIYGYARNDMADWVFTQDSILRTKFQPITHTGLLLGYSLSDMMSVSLLLADPFNTTTGADTSGRAAVAGYPKYNMGLQVKAAMDNMNFAAGWMMAKPVKGTTVNGFDVNAGMGMGNMNLGLDISFQKATSTDAEMGFGLWAKMGMTDMISAAARFEWAKENSTTTAGTKDTTMGFTVGPQFGITKALEVRTDYGLGITKNSAAGAKSAKSHTVNVAAIYKF